MTKKKTVRAFEKGHWYKYTVKHSSTPSGWNDKMMDVCDGKPCLCIFGDNVYAEFKDHMHYDWDSSITDEDIFLKNKATRGWSWSTNMENWVEFDSDSAEKLDLVKYCIDIEAPTFDVQHIASQYIEPTYSFEFPKRSDLRAELLQKLSYL